MTLHPQIIERQGKKEFVVLPYGEFVSMQEAIEDFEDLRALRKEKKNSRNKPATSLEKVIKTLSVNL